MVKTLRECIKEAQAKGVAIGHFNISNLEALNAIYNAAKKLKVPVIIGVSEGEEDFIDTDMVVSMVRTIRERDQYPIFLNADHHYSFERVKQAIDAGFDMAIIDLVKLPIEENIALTKKCVDYAREVSRATGRDILIESELGFIGQSSKILDSIPDGVSEATMTDPGEAQTFIEHTGIDLLAPSVGNIHGMVSSGEPRLHPERVKAIKDMTGLGLVLHGASGNTDEDIQECIKAGVCIVHINTEIRVAYRDAVKHFLNDNPQEVAPYKFLLSGLKAIEAVVEDKLRVFNLMK